MSIDNPQVNANDHKEIAAEMTSLATDCRTWVEKATQYIRSLKTQARGMKGSTEQDFSLPHVIKDVELLLAHRLRLAQCTLTVSCDTADSVLRGDPSKFSQILTNLIGNAIDAHHDAGKKAGEIQVTVAKDTDWWEICISDQGCGIQPENLERIFEEFFSTKPQGIGTGLGLPIVRDLIATFFGGSIHAESILGQGSTFVIRLPDTRQERTPDDDSEAVPVSAQSLQSLRSLRSLIDQAAVG